MTDQPTGRALAEAAARAMGWRSWHDGPVAMAMGPGWVEPDGTIHGEAAGGGPDIPEQKMVDWLCKRGQLCTDSSCGYCGARLWWKAKPAQAPEWVECQTLRDALMRLVVAVAEREAKA